MISQEKRAALRILWGQLRGQNRNEWEHNKVKFLKKIPFFENLRRRQLQEVAKLVYERDYEENEHIFELGQPGAALFIIQQGEVSIEIPCKNGEIGETTQLAVLNKLSFLGELALLDESPRSASARALTKTKALALFRKDLDRLGETHPDITAPIYRALATIIGNRLKATNELIDKRLKVAA